MYGVIEPDENFPKLTNNKSLLAQCLTKEIYSKLFWCKTSSGYTIDQAIQIGIDCEDHEIGFLLGDYECIEVFEPLLGPILDGIHPFFDYKEGNLSHIGNLKMIKFDGSQTLKDFVIEYAFHLRRNLRGYSLPPHCTRAERREINRILIYILKQLEFDASLPHFQRYQNKSKNTAKNTPKTKQKDEKKERDENPANSSNKSVKKQNKNRKKKTDTKKHKKGRKHKDVQTNGPVTDSQDNAISNTHIIESKEDQSQPPVQTVDANGYSAHSEHKYNPNSTPSQVIDLVNIDDLTLTELEEMGLAPSREASLTSEYLIGGLSRDFPDARTLFFNRVAMVGAWTNHENHLEMIIQHTHPDLNYIYKKFVDIYVQFRRILKRKEMAWIRHRRLGIVTTSPKHFGTGLSIQCSIRAPHLANHAKFERIINKRSLELIGMDGNGMNEDCIVNLETMHTLGRSEWQIATDLGNALIDLCRMEKALARNKDIEKLI